MLQIIAILVYLGVLALIYVPVLKKMGESRRLSVSNCMSALLIGLTLCTFCIMIPEINFDRFILKEAKTVPEAIFIAFFRAALIEETVKLLFVKGRLKKKQSLSLPETMLLAGAVGAGYGITEKIVMGGGPILIVNALVPLHVMFQFVMGERLFAAKQAAERGDVREKKREGFKAFWLPFLLHGTWDSLLEASGFLMDSEKEPIMSLGAVAFFAVVAVGVVLEVKLIKRLRRMTEDTFPA